jgi:hypothetical protein
MAKTNAKYEEEEKKATTKERGGKGENRGETPQV